jgi:hypothetical protein
VGCKCVGAYVRNKRNQNQVSMEFAWKWAFSAHDCVLIKREQVLLR